ncbi:MAG: ion transporter [Lachnospiraceae bacterium]
MTDSYKSGKRRLFEIIQIGKDGDRASQLFDVFLVILILANLVIAVMDTYDISAELSRTLSYIENFTIACFAVEYALRLWTSDLLYPMVSKKRAAEKFVFSFEGIIDLLSFLPACLPIFFPAGITALRIFRVIRILRLFRINAYYDGMNIIKEVLVNKVDQLLSSVIIILILMFAASLCMYSLEHEAQPDVFKNAFSGMWWAVAALLTVGYGDIYPITLAGQIFGMAITFLGVLMVAIPTGIISAGCIELYTKQKSLREAAVHADVRFVKLEVRRNHPWAHMKIHELPLPPGLMVVIIQRGERVIVPKGSTQINMGDRLVLVAEGFQDDVGVTLQEVGLGEKHPWVNKKIKEIHFTHNELVVIVKRAGRVLIPNGGLCFEPGDRVYLYRKSGIDLDHSDDVRI